MISIMGAHYLSTRDIKQQTSMLHVTIISIELKRTYVQKTSNLGESSGHYTMVGHDPWCDCILFHAYYCLKTHTTLCKANQIGVR